MEVREAVQELVDGLFAQKVGKNVVDSANVIVSADGKCYLDKTVDISEFDVCAQFVEKTKKITSDNVKAMMEKEKKRRTKKCTT